MHPNLFPRVFRGKIAGLGGPPTHTNLLFTNLAPNHFHVRRNLPPYSERCWLPVWKTIPFSFTASAIARLPYGKRDGLINTASGTGCTNRGFSMPVIGRGDKYGIKRFILKQFQIVIVIFKPFHLSPGVFWNSASR